MTDVQTTSGTRTFDGVEIPEAGVFDLDVAHSSVELQRPAPHGVEDPGPLRHLLRRRHRRPRTRWRPPSRSRSTRPASPPVTSKRDEHLRSADFFDVEQFPEITFRSTRVADHHGDRFRLEGDLTVRGVTRPVVLDAVLEGIATSPWGTQAVGFSASTEIDREAFGLTWNQSLETGGVLVGKTVKVEIEAEINRRAPQEA